MQHPSCRRSCPRIITGRGLNPHDSDRFTPPKKCSYLRKGNEMKSPAISGGLVREMVVIESPNGGLVREMGNPRLFSGKSFAW